MKEHRQLDAAQQPDATGDMDSEAFRRYGHEVVDWMADYLADVGKYPVLAQTAPGDIRRSLPGQPPTQPEAMESILADFDRLLLPGITHWNSPGFMAYFAITGSGPGILGEMLAGALNINAMLWRTSPAATELEQVTLDWLRQMLGLPSTLFGVINDTASSGTLYALAAAREAIPGLHIRQQGMSGRAGVPRLRYYASQEAHSSVEKAGIVLGVGQEGLRKIGVDSEFRMDAAALERAIEEDIAAGWRPFAVVATVGTTSTTSVDPVPQIASVCERYGLWLHVDGAPDFELLAPVPFSTVCFRAHPRGMDDEAELETLNERIMNAINAAGRFFLSHTKLHDKFTIRIAVGNLRTTQQDVQELWKELQAQLVAQVSQRPVERKM